MPINYKNLTPTFYGAGSAIRGVGQKAKSVWDTVPGQVKSVASTAGNVAKTVTNPYGAVVRSLPKVASSANAFTSGLTGKQPSPQMSVEVKKPQTNPKVIQGSGMTGQYASNPTTYKPTPPPTPTPQTMNDWLAGTRALQARNDQFLNTSEAKKLAMRTKQYNDTVNLQNEMYDNANSDLKAEIPVLDERFGKFESGVRANMAQADTIGAENKAQAQTYTGDAQRTAMQNKRQTDAQREKQYAALGTIDSYGTGSFTQGNANADSEFNRSTQQRYDSLAQNLTDIDRTVTNYKTEALALIDTEKAKYEDKVKEINRQLRDNDVARRGAITQAYNETQEAINSISDQYEGLRITAEQDKLTFQQEMDKIAAENTMPTVSDWFKQTGQPQTQDDFNFIYKNPTAATALQKMIGGANGGKKTEKQAAFANAAQSGEYALNLLSSGQVNSGFGQGVAGAWGERFGGNSATQQDYRSTIAAARTLARNAMLGANMSPKELESLSALIPEYSDDPEIAKQKLTTFIREMNRYANTEVASSGLTPEVLASLSQFES